MKLLKLLLLGFLIFQGCISPGQTKLLKKANRLYKADQFSEAAKLFEEVMKTENNLATKTKLAYCYRMNNHLDTAEILYAQIVREDKAKARTYFYYGEILMANGKYEEAKKWFLKYSNLKPEDEKGAMLAKACERVKSIQPYFHNIIVTEFSQNSKADDSNPVFWGSSIVFSSDRDPGIKLLKQKSGWTGRDYINLFTSEYINDTTFSEPKPFSSKLNQTNKNTGNSSFSNDGNTIFFAQNGGTESRKGIYNMQLFSAELSANAKWKSPEKLPFCSPQYNYMHPSISPDGKWLFFVSDKPGGQGGADIWFSKKGETAGGKSRTWAKKLIHLLMKGFRLPTIWDDYSFVRKDIQAWADLTFLLRK